jgi:hypothetical protein
MAAYKLTSNPSIVQRTSDGAGIPADLRNGDWVAYQAWLVAGNIPDPADPLAVPAAPPLTVDELAAMLVQKAVIQVSDLVTAKAAPAVSASVNAVN